MYNHQFFNEEIIPFVDQAISSSGKHYDEYETLRLWDLNEMDQRKLSALFMEWKRSHLDPLLESNQSMSVVEHLIALLKNDNRDNQIDFAEKCMDVVTSYYEEEMDELVGYRCQRIIQERHEEAGYERRYHRDNGEMYWRAP